MKKTLIHGFLILSIAILGSSAHAEDFTFNIPVELHKIPASITKFQLSGEVFDNNKSRIGYGNSDHITIVNGEYLGTVTLKFNAEPANGAIPAKDPSKATSYSVYILINDAGGCLNVMNLDGPYPYDPSKPLVCGVSGNLPATITPMKSGTAIVNPVKPLPAKILTQPKPLTK
jgi:hypothetical protein